MEGELPASPSILYLSMRMEAVSCRWRRHERARARSTRSTQDDRLVSIQFSVSPLQAVLEYVRSYGVKDDEITRLGVDCVSWQRALGSRSARSYRIPAG